MSIFLDHFTLIPIICGISMTCIYFFNHIVRVLRLIPIRAILRYGQLEDLVYCRLSTPLVADVHCGQIPSPAAR